MKIDEWCDTQKWINYDPRNAPESSVLHRWYTHLQSKDLDMSDDEWDECLMEWLLD